MRKHKKIASLLINEVDPKSDPEPDPDPDPKFPEKSDPDPKKIISDPQHWSPDSPVTHRYLQG